MKKLSLFILSLLILSSSSTLLLSSASAQSVNCLASPLSKAECSIFGNEKLVCEQIACFFDQQKNNPNPWYLQSHTQFADKVLNSPEEEVFGERYYLFGTTSILNSFYVIINQFAGVTSFEKFIEVINLMSTTIKTLQEQSTSGSLPDFKLYAQLGPAGILSYGITTLYANPPASAVGEIKYTASRLIDPFSPSAYAQGAGFSGLNNNGASSAVRALWTASRNAAYIITAILLIASGLMVMFRVKLNPQTVISVQQMIPKLIMTLLLITFSFAIAGLIIDLIFVALIGIASFLTPATGTIRNIFLGIGWNANIGSIFSLSGFGTYTILQALILLPTIGIFFALFAIITLIIGIPFAAPTGGLSLGVGPVVGLIIVLILLIHFFLTLFKIFKIMLVSYVFLILRICFAPIFIMLDIIPGQQGFGPWIRGVLAEASVFVVIPLMLILEDFFLPIIGSGLFGFKDWVALGGSGLNLPFFSAGALSGGTGLASWIPRFFIAYAIFSLAPKAAEITKDMLKVPAFKYGQAIDEGLGAIGGAVKKPYDLGMGYLSGYAGGQADPKSGLPNWQKGIWKAVQTGADITRGK